MSANYADYVQRTHFLKRDPLLASAFLLLGLPRVQLLTGSSKDPIAFSVPGTERGFPTCETGASLACLSKQYIPQWPETGNS